MENKIELVVLNERILGYKDPKNNFLNVLSAPIRKGCNSWDENGDNKYISSTDKVRLATEEDFEDFMISIDGYRNDPKYVYDRKKLTDL